MTPDETKLFLRRAAARDRLSGSFLLFGGNAVQRADLGLFLARLVCCEAADKPCGACPACGRVEKGGHPDVRLIAPEHGVLLIDEVRAVKDDLYVTPYTAPKKVYVFVVESMKDEAANAFLKMLEEPPSHAVLVLASSTTNYFLPTILSRCRRLRLNFILPEYGETMQKSQEVFLALLTAALEGRFDPFFKGVDRLAKDMERETIGTWLEQAVWLYRDALLAQQRVPNGLLVNRAMDGRIHGTEDPLGGMEHILEMKGRFRYNINVRLGLEALFLQLAS